MGAEERPAKAPRLDEDPATMASPPAAPPAAAPAAQGAAPPDPAPSPPAPGGPADPEDHSLPAGPPVAADPEDPEDLSASAALPFAAGPPTPTGAAAALSKNAQKRQRRAEAWEAGRPARAARRREERARKRERARANPAGNGTAARRARHKPEPGARLSGATVVLDCGFDGLMTDREVVSLSSQVTRCYAQNAQARRRVALAVAGFAPGTRLRDRFDSALEGHWRNWKGVRFFDGGLRQALDALRRDQPAPPPAAQGAAGPAAADAQDPAEVVYLTADSPHVLHALAPRGVYVVGALVDRNRHKGVCYRAALELGVRTARLPIEEHMKLASRQVLTTNHVIEVLLGWLGGGGWGAAFEATIPKRKLDELLGDGEPDAGEEEEEEGRGGPAGGGHGADEEGSVDSPRQDAEAVPPPLMDEGADLPA